MSDTDTDIDPGSVYGRFYVRIEGRFVGKQPGAAVLGSIYALDNQTFARNLNLDPFEFRFLSSNWQKVSFEGSRI